MCGKGVSLLTTSITLVADACILILGFIASFSFSFRDDTHKVDVINFAQNKAMRCSQNETLIDRESARLLWDFIVLLCRQNGV